MARRSRQTGFTLMECLLASTILAISVVAIAQAISYGQRATSDSLRELRALELAEALMNEIAARPYYNASHLAPLGAPTGVTARINFTCVANYHGLTEAAGSVADITGTTYPSLYQVFGRSVTCTAATTTLTGLSAQTGLTVTVTVTDNRKRTWTLSRFVPDPG